MADFGDVLAADYLAGGPGGPPEQPPVIAVLNGNTVITFVTGGVRYAAIGATQTDAQNLLNTDPGDCTVP